MLTTVDTLQEGDEIIIGCHGDLRYTKLLRTPRLSKGKAHYVTGAPVYGKVKCSYHAAIRPRTYNYTDYNGQVQTRTYNERYSNCDGLEHNREVYLDLNYKHIWLVKRAEQI